MTHRFTAGSCLGALFGLLLMGCKHDDAERPRGGCKPADNVLLCGEPLLIAHRGGGRLRPESTLPAFEHAATLGAHVLELDVHTTADGHVVCIHDATVDRTTDGVDAVQALSLAELQALDAGYRFSTDGGATHPWRGKGVVVPTLEAVLQQHPDAWFSIEIKQRVPNMVDALLAVLDANGANQRVVVVSFYDEVVAEVRAKRPTVLTGMGLAEMLELSTLDDELEKSYQPATRIVQPPFASITEEMIARAGRLDLRLHAWTVNDHPEMERQLDLGTHGIMTDDPALLAQVLAERGSGSK